MARTEEEAGLERVGGFREGVTPVAVGPGGEAHSWQLFHQLYELVSELQLQLGRLTEDSPSSGNYSVLGILHLITRSAAQLEEMEILERGVRAQEFFAEAVRSGCLDQELLDLMLKSVETIRDLVLAARDRSSQPPEKSPSR